MQNTKAACCYRRLLRVEQLLEMPDYLPAVSVV